jgi:hypothetical protein
MLLLTILISSANTQDLSIYKSCFWNTVKKTNDKGIILTFSILLFKRESKDFLKIEARFPTNN